MASCIECHTQRDGSGTFLPGMGFAGGVQFADSGHGYRVRSANITPDADTGIGSWTEEQFVDKFKGFETPSDHVLTDEEQRQNSVMPWTPYGGMTKRGSGGDLHLPPTLKPVTHRVEKWPDARATKCVGFWVLRSRFEVEFGVLRSGFRFSRQGARTSKPKPEP